MVYWTCYFLKWLKPFLNMLPDTPTFSIPFFSLVLPPRSRTLLLVPISSNLSENTQSVIVCQASIGPPLTRIEILRSGYRVYLNKFEVCFDEFRLGMQRKCNRRRSGKSWFVWIDYQLMFVKCSSARFSTIFIASEGFLSATTTRCMFIFLTSYYRWFRFWIN